MIFFFLPFSIISANKKALLLNHAFLCKFIAGRTISRVMSRTVIYLAPSLPQESINPPKTRRAAVLFLFGLSSDGVYICLFCYQKSGSLLHCLSTLTAKAAVYFCCTFLRVTSTGRYPASCPVKPGLSSSAPFRDLQPRLFILPASLIPYHNLPSLASPSSTILSDPSAAVVASSSHRSFWG